MKIRTYKEAAGVVALVLLAAALSVFVHGCGGGAPRVERPTSRQARAIAALNGAAKAVDVVAGLCPLPQRGCPEVRASAAILAEGLEATAEAIAAGGTPGDVGTCVAPLSLVLLDQLAALDVKVSPKLVLALSLALAFVPECEPSAPDAGVD